MDNTYGGEPWWLPLYPSNNPLTFRFQMSTVGMFLTKNMVWLLEQFW